MDNNRSQSIDSLNNIMPIIATPTAPIPVQTAYAVPIGNVLSAHINNPKLPIAETAVMILGQSLVNPSLYLRLKAKIISIKPAENNSNHAMSNILSLYTKAEYFTIVCYISLHSISIN